MISNDLFFWLEMRMVYDDSRFLLEMRMIFGDMRLASQNLYFWRNADVFWWFTFLIEKVDGFWWSTFLAWNVDDYQLFVFFIWNTGGYHWYARLTPFDLCFGLEMHLVVNSSCFGWNADVILDEMQIIHYYLHLDIFVQIFWSTKYKIFITSLVLKNVLQYFGSLLVHSQPLRFYSFSYSHFKSFKHGLRVRVSLLIARDLKSLIFWQKISQDLRHRFCRSNFLFKTQGLSTIKSSWPLSFFFNLSSFFCKFW